MRQTHQPLFGTSFRKYVSQSVGDLESEARTRPAPGPHQFFFSDVTQFDLTDGAGQSRDLRATAEIFGKLSKISTARKAQVALVLFEVGSFQCVPGERCGRWLASMPGRFAETLDSGPQDNWKKSSCPVGGQLEKFLGRILTLARAPMPGRWRCVHPASLRWSLPRRAGWRLWVLNTAASTLILRPWPLCRARKPVWFRIKTCSRCGRPTLLSGTAGSQTRKGCTTPRARSPMRCAGCTSQTSSGCKKRKSDERSHSASAGAQMPGWQNTRRGPTQRGSKT